jgi:hypothetical protein
MMTLQEFKDTFGLNTINFYHSNTEGSNRLVARFKYDSVDYRIMTSNSFKQEAGNFTVVPNDPALTQIPGDNIFWLTNAKEAAMSL